MSNEEKKSESAYKEGERKSYNYVIDKLIIEKECKAFAAWIMNTPIQGRTLGKLWIDYKQLPVSAPSESQEEMRTKLQRYQQTLIARYYNNDLTEKEKIDLNKIIDELSDLLK